MICIPFNSSTAEAQIRAGSFAGCPPRARRGIHNRSERVILEGKATLECRVALLSYDSILLENCD